MGRRTGIVNIVAVALVLTSAAVYTMNTSHVPPSVGFALALSLASVLIASIESLPPRMNVAVCAVVVTIGLGTVIVLGQPTDHVTRILRNLAWSQAALGVWMTYSALLTLSVTKRIDIGFDDTSQSRWREGDAAFGVDFARRIVVRAQPSWAALVVETAWPAPRPEIVEELVKVLASAPHDEVGALKEKMKGKGGTSSSDVRFELARLACDVVLETKERDANDVGGHSVGRFIVHAAKAVRDDEDAKRIFSALVLPAVARRA